MKTALPSPLVAPFTVPLSTALEQGGAPLKLIATEAPVTGALLASVTCTRTGLARICPPMEFCGWLMKVTVAGTAVVPAAKMSIT